MADEKDDVLEEEFDPKDIDDEFGGDLDEDLFEDEFDSPAPGLGEELLFSSRIDRSFGEE